MSPGPSVVNRPFAGRRRRPANAPGRSALLRHIVVTCNIRHGNPALVRDLLDLVRNGPFDTVEAFQRASRTDLTTGWQPSHRLALAAVCRSKGFTAVPRRARGTRGARRWLSAEEAVALGGARLPLERHAAHRAIILAAQRQRWSPLVVRTIADLVRHDDGVAAWDCVGVTEALARCPRYTRMHPGNRRRVLSALQDAKLAPEFDPDGTYASHLRCVPRTVMERHPDLWQLPVRFARRVARTASDADAELLVAVGRRVVTEPLLADPRWQHQRLRESRTIQVFAVLSAVQRAVDPASLRDAFLGVQGVEGAVDLLARTVASSQRRPSTTRLPEDMVGRKMDRLLMDFHALIRCGVLESQGVPCDTTISRRSLVQRMLQLEGTDPARYRAVEPPPVVRPAPALSDADVDRLYAACRTPRETAVLALLAESAFRAGAVARCRLGDVWDADRRCVRGTIALWEKGSKLRRNVPNDRLKEALRVYIADIAPPWPPTAWLFPHRRHPRRLYADGPRHVVATLARRVGLSGVSPHAFRRYVVNRAMRAGNRLESVQKWLGHASSATTMRHYWTDDLAELDVTTHQSSRALEDEVATLRARVAWLEKQDTHREEEWWQRC